MRPGSAKRALGPLAEHEERLRAATDQALKASITAPLAAAVSALPRMFSEATASACA